ncbi:MAG TPA: SDR family oxidoreductase [Sandaracinaceae bacterium LLY-WYZ-13_1]|nr:SDR family oxidoreductase [Sandaracinaceae bacterium LLY-WYZ-13_1]
MSKKKTGWSGRNVIITGGATGIGRAMAEELLRRGATVTVCGRRREKLEAAARELPGLEIVQADITADEDRRRLFTTVADRHGPVDALVNNAAAFDTILDLERDLTTAMVERELATNVAAPILLSRLFAEQLPAGADGRVVNIGSIVAWLSLDTQAVYAATKAALHSFSRSSRPLLEPWGVTVHEVMTPGVDTSMVDAIEMKKMAPEVYARHIADAVERGTEEIRVGPDATLAHLGSRLFPSLLDRLVRSRLSYRD